MTVGERVLAAGKPVVSVAQKNGQSKSVQRIYQIMVILKICVEMSFLEYVMSTSVIPKHRFASTPFSPCF